MYRNTIVRTFISLLDRGGSPGAGASAAPF
jgi:hypothetical protein